MPPTALALAHENQQEISGDISPAEEIETGPARLEARCVTTFGSAQGTAIIRAADIDALPTATKIIRVTLTRDTQPFPSTLKEATVGGLKDELHDPRTGACACESCQYHISTSTATATSIYTSTTTSTVFITGLQYKCRPTPHTPKSHVARASPPTFFHPHHPTPRQLPKSPSNLSPYDGNVTAEPLPPLSIAVLVLALLVMAVGAAWVVVVYWVNFPPTWLIGRETKQDTPQFNGRRRIRGWRAWFGGGRLFGRPRRPLDKQSRYARLGSSDEYDSDGEANWQRNRGGRDGDVERAAGKAMGNGTESAMSTATLFTQPLFSAGPAIELRERKGKTAQHARCSSERLRHADPHKSGTADTLSSSSSSTPNGHSNGDGDGKRRTRTAARRRTISLPAFQLPPTNSTIQPPVSPSSPSAVSPTSPHNPLLPSLPPNPSLHHRNSATWLRDREAFFSSLKSPPPLDPISIPIPTLNPQRPLGPSLHTSNHSPSPRCSFDSVSDLESQSQCSQADGNGLSTQLRGGYVALLNGRRGNGSGNGNGTGKRRVDENGNGNAKAWLKAVDGAVNRVVDRMVRWTDDRDGEEGLLLPVAE